MNDRVEAAAKLRDLSYNPRVLINEPNPAEAWHGTNVMYHIIDAIGCFKVSNCVGYDRAVRRLADIIDTTCHNKQIEINKMAPLEFRIDNLICSNCGETFCADPDGINAPIDWAYCPNCGYRIVETNSGEDNNSER